ncbi:YheC/YheD family protein [Brevibacillus massiliensis]|uniref:YheC/YheD family endospore coat-associated protein n=1 Tax=Brevibacillus massiliensis TaxID=1118054 RepID=UPI000302E33F|nr:YheC/YheD family protein [Brevibacillus massiliensis]
MSKPVIGILTSREGKRFAEPAYFRRLIREGRNLGAVVFLFSPDDVRENSRRVRGFTPAVQGGWEERWYPWPDVAIDRFRYSPTPAFKRYAAFRKRSGLLFANNRLAHKWNVHQVLWQDERMRKWLPETYAYDSSRLQTMLRKHRSVYVKPSNGTGGRDILKIEQKGGGFLLQGHNQQRSRRSAELSGARELARWVDRWVKNKKFLIQQGLDLQLIPGHNVDLRLLIQKNGEGNWSITGAGARVGGKKNIASNLHAGGKAVPAAQFLTPLFGREQAEAILRECRDLAFQTVETIENHYGRMMEQGLDIGVDVNGRVWLIEVNPKPGREIFREMRQRQNYLESIRKPLQYALYLTRSMAKIHSS